MRAGKSYNRKVNKKRTKIKSETKQETDMKKILMTLSLALAAAIAIPAANAQDVNSQQNSCCNQQKAVCTQQQKEMCKQTSCAQTACVNTQTPCQNAECTDSTCAQPRKMKGFAKGKKGHRKFDKSAAHHGRRMNPKGGNPLFKGITLTEAQQKELNALREKRAAERKAEMSKKAESFDKDVEKILTADQLKQFKANKEAMQNQKRGERR